MDNQDGKSSTVHTTLLVNKTMRWLWLQKQLYQFIHRSLRKKRIALEIEEKEALNKSLFFRQRMYREIRKHPNAFIQSGIESSIEADNDNEGEEWKNNKS